MYLTVQILKLAYIPITTHLYKYKNTKPRNVEREKKRSCLGNMTGAKIKRKVLQCNTM